MNGVITTAYFAPESETSNPWVQTEKKILQQYAPSLYAKSGLDGNTQYGMALAYTFVQALQKAGKNLTRQSLMTPSTSTARASSRRASCPSRTRARCISASRVKRS